MIQALQLYLNLQGRALVTSPNDSTSPALAFMQGDTYQLVLNGLLPVLDNSLTLFAAAHIDWSRLSAGITLIDAPPTGGTFQVQVGTGGTALTTPILGFAVGKGDLQAALNALANVITAGGIDVVTTGAPNIYQYNWRIPANILPLAVVGNELSPMCLVRIAVDPDIVAPMGQKTDEPLNQFSLPDALANPRRISPAIDDRIDGHNGCTESVIDSEREVTAQKAMIVAMDNPVNTCGNLKSFDIRFQGGKKVIS